MFTITKSSNPSISARTVSESSTSPAKKSSLGVTSKEVTSSKKKKKSKADSAGFVSESSYPSGMAGTNVSSLPLGVDMEPLLTGFTGSSEKQFLKLYRDIYYYDSVCGSAVDLMSSLPFSEFTLGGISNRKVNSVFQENIERLGLRTLLPEISIDYLVTGCHCSSLLYNKEKKIFTDIMTHSAENLTVEDLPFYSQDPILTVAFPAEIRNAVSKNTPRIERLRKLVGQGILDKIAAGSLELDPLSTIYVPRRTFSSTDVGTSYFKRILPLYLIEKNLYRGTLVESSRRQRGIMHLTLGDGDQWEPSVADLEYMTDLFMNADSDPLGAIIATRAGVMVEEIRNGGDFWKVTDFSDSIFNYKLRALGISEGFLSGEANYSTADQSLSVFIDMIRTYRDMLTRKLFYDKLFPLISLINGYTVTSKGTISIKDNFMESMTADEASFSLNDGSKLLVPTVSWNKQLKPEGDSAYIELLNTLTEKGIPVPLRVMAAAGGLNLDELLKQQNDDIEVRKSIQDYMARIAALTPKSEGGGGEEEAAEARSLVLASVNPAGGTRSAVLAGGGRIPLLSRNFGEASEIRGKTKTGKDRLIVDQRSANAKINKSISVAMKRANKRGDFNASTVSFKTK